VQFDFSAPLFAMASILVAEHVRQAACCFGSVRNSGQNQPSLPQLMNLRQAKQIPPLPVKRRARKVWSIPLLEKFREEKPFVSWAISPKYFREV